MMRVTRSFATFGALLVVLATPAALADASRESLLEAWQAHVAALPGTVRFEATGDETFVLEDSDLPYEGELRLVGALVRSSESPGLSNDYTHLGMVEFELVDLPAERMGSQLYYYWLTDRQTMHYSASRGEWVDNRTYTESFSGQYDLETNFGFLSFMLNYGIWILLVALIIYVFLAIGKASKKNRALMDETAAINEKARENVERAASLQDEVIAISKEARDLQAENNAILRRILETLQR